MRNKKGGGAKVLTKPPAEIHKASSLDDSPNLSAICKVSFLEGLQGNHGNFLHSTAIEEELNDLEEGRMDTDKAGREDDAQVKAKRHRVATKRKNTESNEEKKTKRGRRSAGRKAEARKGPDERQGNYQKKAERNKAGAYAVPQTTEQQKDDRHLVRKKPTKRTSPGKTRPVRPLKNQQMKDTKRKSELDDEKLSDPESQESDTDVDRQRRKRVLSSDEEVNDDTSSKPTPKKAKVKGSGRSRQSSSDGSKSRKSSSGSAYAEAERPEKRGHQPGTELEVVLDTFLHFCEQYRESVDSTAVKESIHLFSYNVKEQLLEKISSYTQIRILKRENAKVGSLICTKTRRLFDAKYELMRVERQLLLLQKERSELKRRLKDLRRCNAFLHDLRELNQRYLDYRHKHPKAKEKYGSSSLTALLLETKHIQRTEHQLRSINNRMEKRLFKNNGTCK